MPGPGLVETSAEAEARIASTVEQRLRDEYDVALETHKEALRRAMAEELDSLAARQRKALADDAEAQLRRSLRAGLTAVDLGHIEDLPQPPSDVDAMTQASSEEVAQSPRVLSMLGRLHETRRLKRVAEAAEWELAVQFALAHTRLVEPDGAASTVSGVVIPGSEQLVQAAGDGTPRIAEFAHLELAAGLGVPEADAAGLMLTALGCRFRMPRLWDLVMDGQVEVWRAGKLVQATHELSQSACLRVDDQVAARVATMSFGRLRRLVDGLVLAELPQPVAQQKRADALERRCAWIRQASSGNAELTAVLNSADGVHLDAQLARIAGILADNGSTDTLDARRARALGILASPAHALQLLQSSLVHELPGMSVSAGHHEQASATLAQQLGSPAGQPGEVSCEPAPHRPNPVEPVVEPGWAVDPESACPGRGRREHTCGTITIDPDRLLPRAQVVVHLTDATLKDGDGIVRAEHLKPMLAGWLKDLLGHSRVRVTPVVDIAGMAPADSYEIPERMREAVIQRNPYSAFPFSNRRSRTRRGSSTLDLDHTIPFEHGDAGQSRPGGQTRPANLAPLTRTQHRAKTHGGWKVDQLVDGVFLWKSPAGQSFLVTPSGTLNLTPRLKNGRKEAAA